MILKSITSNIIASSYNMTLDDNISMKMLIYMKISRIFFKITLKNDKNHPRFWWNNEGFGLSACYCCQLNSV